ncbi:unnamed protein product [Schistocephalus solidus]|uniref:Uncharacterized protein n=1 Tax=Schistocephalus solidus TaxID=70667 RepID=A0A183TGV4_SCHSO|nr:unnamed protein product [Schistocephalus solidus]
MESLAKERSDVEGRAKEFGVVKSHAKEDWAEEGPTASEPFVCRCRGSVAVPWQRHRLENPVWRQELCEIHRLMGRRLGPRDRPYKWPHLAEQYRRQP